jgi:hypothetical protein
LTSVLSVGMKWGVWKPTKLLLLPDAPNVRPGGGSKEEGATEEESGKVKKKKKKNRQSGQKEKASM